MIKKDKFPGKGSMKSRVIRDAQDDKYFIFNNMHNLSSISDVAGCRIWVESMGAENVDKGKAANKTLLLIRPMNTVRNAPQVLHSPTPATKDLSPGTPAVQDDNSLVTLFICRSYSCPLSAVCRPLSAVSRGR
jgi:hypothetical protein